MDDQRIPESGAGAPAPAPYAADPYEYGDARALIEGLDLAEPVAITLVRRGHRTVEQAEAFLRADVRHDGTRFAGIDEVVARIRDAIEAGRRITVHGDYDVDGIAATAILVSALSQAGAECDWLIPDRLADGYGVSAATVERLAERGTELLVTADCGIGSPGEIELAARAGIETIVTDHHHPGERLPDCPIVHPTVSGYPFGGLCGAAVAHKLAEQLELAAGGDGGRAARGLDLVALATVADLVPLVDENRTLARLGIAELRRARRPGVRALLAAAGIEAEHLDEGDIAFRLAPRLNAAGRLYRADAAVELMLTDDEGRAARVAAELDGANRERRELEREVYAAASAALRALPEELREAPGLVLAGEGWHPGVIGIAASRIAERHERPAVLLSIDEHGRVRGSGRSVSGFDLLAALERCAAHLDRYGGHRAAAGVELDAGAVEAFRQAFAEAAAEQLTVSPRRRAERIDAVVGAEALDLELAEQLRELGPFGQGNPTVRLLVPWARVGEVRPMGKGGRHARFTLGSGASRAAGVAFDANGALSAAQGRPSDLTVRVELNHWNGAVTSRAVLEGARTEADPDADRVCGCPAAGADELWWERFELELGTDPSATPWPAGGEHAGGRSGREVVAHPRLSAVALIGELLSSGERVLALAADARRRARLATVAATPARFGGDSAVVCGGCRPERAAAAARGEGPQLVLADWETLARSLGLAAGFAHVVLVDPPPDPAIPPLLAAGPGFLHEAWAGAGELPALCWAERWQPRAALAEIYRGAAAGPLRSGALDQLLLGAGTFPRLPEVAARCVRVLGELTLAELAGERGARELRVVSSERTELERSRAWRAFAARHEEGLRFLQSRTAT